MEVGRPKGSEFVLWPTNSAIIYCYFLFEGYVAPVNSTVCAQGLPYGKGQPTCGRDARGSLDQSARHAVSLVQDSQLGMWLSKAGDVEFW